MLLDPTDGIPQALLVIANGVVVSLIRTPRATGQILGNALVLKAIVNPSSVALGSIAALVV